VQLPVGTKFEVTDALAKRLEKIVSASVPEMKSLRSNVGGGTGFLSASGSHAANLQLRLVKKAERKRSTNEVVAELRKVTSGVSDAKIWVSSRGSFITRLLQRGGRQNRIEVEVRGHDLEGGAVLAEQVKTLVESVQGVVNVRIS